MRVVLWIAITSVLGVAGCATWHAKDVAAPDDPLTVGTVQTEIKAGMSGAGVAEALGSPNIVTTDEKGREVWIYDRISREVRYSKSSGGIVGLLVLGSGGGIGGGSIGSGAESSSQKTLTVIIKFDENKQVREFGYHASRF